MGSFTFVGDTHFLLFQKIHMIEEGCHMSLYYYLSDEYARKVEYLDSDRE